MLQPSMSRPVTQHMEAANLPATLQHPAHNKYQSYSAKRSHQNANQTSDRQNNNNKLRCAKWTFDVRIQVLTFLLTQTSTTTTVTTTDGDHIQIPPGQEVVVTQDHVDGNGGATAIDPLNLAPVL